MPHPMGRWLGLATSSTGSDSGYGRQTAFIQAEGAGGRVADDRQRIDVIDIALLHQSSTVVTGLSLGRWVVRLGGSIDSSFQSCS